MARKSTLISPELPSMEIISYMRGKLWAQEKEIRIMIPQVANGLRNIVGASKFQSSLD
jgi:hypothetical protein